MTFADYRAAAFAAILALLLILMDVRTPPSAPGTQLAFPWYMASETPARSKSFIQDSIAAWKLGTKVRRNRRYLRNYGGNSLAFYTEGLKR